MGLECSRTKRVDVRLRQRRSFARGDRRRKRFLRGNPALALRRSRRGRQPFRLTGNGLERRFAAAGLID